MIDLGVVRVMAPWEREAQVRTRTAIRRFAKPLAELLERDAGRDDTRLIVADLLRQALGLEDLTIECAADYGVRVDGRLVALVEVRRCTQRLDLRHLRQVQMAAVNAGVAWVILTSGRVWQVYHLTGRLPLIVDRVLDVDLLGEGSLTRKVDGLFPLTREALKRRLLDELWRETTSRAGTV